MSEPLILTLLLDPQSHADFDALRRQHFPPDRNIIPAHLTLFHKLPGGEVAAISERLDRLARERTPFLMQTSGVRFLGRGVAIEIASPELGILRGELASSWANCLGAQDRQKFRPHVTVQNKAPAVQAKALQQELLSTFAPSPIMAHGLCLWRYKGGPWDCVHVFRFRQS